MARELHIVDSPDCGNAPRKAIVRDLAVALAHGDAGALTPALHDDAEWTVVGDRKIRGATEIGAWAASAPRAVELRFASVLTHGREASMSGTLTLASGSLRSFCHVIRFASASKAALVTSVTSYVITVTGRD